jgi:hypothetical protein
VMEHSSTLCCVTKPATSKLGKEVCGQLPPQIVLRAHES